MRVITIPQGVVRAAVPQESDDEPYKEQRRHRDGHDHVLDLMTQVHEFGDDIEGLGTGEDQIDAVEHIFIGKPRLQMDGRQDQLNHGDPQQDPEGPPDRLGVE